MAYETKNNTGNLFINGFKREPKHPKWKGLCKVNGREMEFSAWDENREGKPLLDKMGRPYLSFSFSEPREKKEDDGIPF